MHLILQMQLLQLFQNLIQIHRLSIWRRPVTFTEVISFQDSVPLNGLFQFRLNLRNIMTDA